ncbi:putative uncharacterized protein [Firmicutes bacterium CAG:882]|nr:putative uncharacterized protein [Firmicutes bacterium CAG:882]
MPSENVNKKLLNLDIIRAVAAIMIVLVHLELFGWGGHGVELFLLLTGYTAFLSIDRHKDISPLSYYRRRLARILPSYYGVVLIYFFIYLAVLGERYPAKQVVVSLIKYFTLTTTFFPRDLIFWFYLGTTGTIVTIMLFYIIAPFLYKLINNFKRSVIALFIAFAVCQVWVHFLGRLYAGTEYAGRHPAYFIYLCFFGVAAYFAVKEKRIFEYIAVLMVMGVGFLILDVSNTKLYWIIMFTTLLLVTMDIEDWIPDNRLSRGAVTVVRFISKYSYALYLGHPIGILIMKSIFDPDTTTMPIVLYRIVEVGLFAVMTAVVYFAFEKPAAKLFGSGKKTSVKDKAVKQ